MIAEILISNFVLAVLTPVLSLMAGAVVIGVTIALAVRAHNIREEREGQRIVEEGARER